MHSTLSTVLFVAFLFVAAMVAYYFLVWRPIWIATDEVLATVAISDVE